MVATKKTKEMARMMMRSTDGCKADKVENNMASSTVPNRKGTKGEGGASHEALEYCCSCMEGVTLD